MQLPLRGKTPPGLRLLGLLVLQQHRHVRRLQLPLLGDTAAFQAGPGAALAAAIVVPSLRPGALAAALATTEFHALNQ